MNKRLFLITIIVVMAAAFVLGGCNAPAADSESPLKVGPAYFDDSRGSWSPTIDNDSDKFKYYNSFGDGLNPLLYPEYEDYIDWYILPPDYVGGYGTIVEVQDPKKGYVNIRSGPSLKYNVINKLQPYSEDYWILDVEMFITDEGYHVGTYYVESDNYTWSPVYQWDEEENRPLRGWVALEVCSFWGF